MKTLLYSKFQFHYGSVKSIDNQIFPEKITEFQFHYGSVKSYDKSELDQNTKTISIPLWFG